MKVKFFAQIREITGTESLEMAVPADATIEGVRQALMAKGSTWHEALSANVLCACNQTLCDGTRAVSDQDEVAFFPPVTGG
ncbi:molybdopterin converting factor subunit 1 [Alteromonas sp. ZYF713]|nr:molybdopterin converting factor subunit 1 [Alteromonas sp. ZYF713]